MRSGRGMAGPAGGDGCTAPEARLGQDRCAADRLPAGGGRVLGLYTTKRRASQTRPYRTTLAGVDPIEARCDCPDFVKNALGICKHVLTVLEDIHGEPRLAQEGIEEQASSVKNRDPASWEPIRPLTGAGDWLERVVWAGRNGTEARDEGRARPFLSGSAQVDGDWPLRNSYPDQPGGGSARQRAAGGPPVRPRSARARPRAPCALLQGEGATQTDRRTGTGAGGDQGRLKGLKRALYPYQREGVERFLAVGRLLLADDMGLGKTAQAIASCHILWRAGRVRRGLVIAPASLKPQWAREWAQFSDLPIQVIDGSPPERQAFYPSHKDGLFIINYEQLLRDLEIVRAMGARPRRARRGPADQELGDQDGALGQGADARRIASS